MKKFIRKTVLSAATAILILAASVGTLFLSAGTALAGTDNQLTVFVTIVDKGTLKLSNEKITLSGTAGQQFTIDDALYAAHELFYEGGAQAGYGSEETAYGLSMTKLWGDVSGAYGYYVNNASAWELSQTLSANDVVYAFVYSDRTLWSDAFSFFESTSYEASSGTPLIVTLKYISGYDMETFAPIESPLEGATVSCVESKSGAASSAVTDAGGEAALTFTADGIYKITASKAGTVLAPAVATVYVGLGQKEAEPEKKVNVTRPQQEKATSYEYGNEWAIILEQREGILTEENALKYYNSIVKVLGEKKSPQLDRSRGTENSRVILGLTAAGWDATDVNGFNLLAPLSDYAFVTKQGVNGVMYALLAINCHDYTIPKAAEGKTQATGENLVQYLLDNMTGAGWSYSGDTPDVDMTAIAVYALAPYYEENEKIVAAIDGALLWLSDNQTARGSYKESFTGKENSCSVSEVILALSTLGISSMNDSRFIKNNISLHNALNLFRTDGGYKYLTDDTEPLAYATTSAKRALIAYDRMVNGESVYFDFNEVTLKVGPKSEIPKTADPMAFVLWFMVFSGTAVLLAAGAANISEWKKEK